MDININKILVQLGIGSKETIYMSVSPIVGLEIIKVDALTKTIVSYANRPLEYNESTREIANFEEFKAAIKDMCEELRINPHCNVVLNLPMVLFGSKDIPLILGDDAVNEVLISEAEQTYTFTRHDPLVAWTDAGSNPSGETRKVFYSALQKDFVENIENALADIGATLISINTSISSIINGLYFSGLAASQMQSNANWNLLIVGLGGYSLCAMQGSKILDYYEEPLALKSFDGNELYNAITSSLQLVLMNYAANDMYIISDTNLVSAEILSSRLSNIVAIKGYLENNTYRKDEFIPASLEILPDKVSEISFEAIGIAISNQPNLPLYMEFIHGHTLETEIEDNSPVKIKIREKEYEIWPETAAKIAGGIAAILVIPVLVLYLLIPAISANRQTKLDELDKQAAKLESKVKAYSDEDAQLDSFDVKHVINETLKNNRAKLMAYTALGETVPKSVWLTYFFTYQDGKIDIKGASTNVEDISVFYKNLKDSLINTKLRLSGLEMATVDIEDAIENTPKSYVFEITNMTESELKEISKSSQTTTEDVKSKNDKDVEDDSDDTKASSKSKKTKKNSKSSSKKSAPADSSLEEVPETLPSGL